MLQSTGHKESDTTERPNGTYSCTGLSEWKSIWPSWCTTSTPATMITCWCGPLRYARSGWGEKLTCIHRMGYFVLWLLNSSSVECSLCEHSHGVQISSHPPPSHSGRSIQTVFPRLYSPPNSNHGPSKSLTIQQNHWLQPMNQCAIIHLAISPSKQNKQLSALVEVLPTGRTPLHGCPSGLSQRGCSFAAVHFWWYLHILQDHLESRPKEKSWVSWI